MYNLNRKITSVFFILPGLIPMLFAFGFMLKQQSIRNRMRQRLEDEILHVVTIPDHEVNWTEKDKEILVEGRMFDVKFIEHRDGKTILHGLYDDDETILNKAFNKSWKKKNAQQTHLLAQLFHCMRGFYFSAAPDFTFPQYETEYNYVSFSPRLMSQVKLIPTPPPQC